MWNHFYHPSFTLFFISPTYASPPSTSGTPPSTSALHLQLAYVFKSEIIFVVPPISSSWTYLSMAAHYAPPSNCIWNQPHSRPPQLKSMGFSLSSTLLLLRSSSHGIFWWRRFCQQLGRRPSTITGSVPFLSAIRIGHLGHGCEH